MGRHAFTYGVNHGHGLNAYTLIEGVTDEVARELQFTLHGPEWAFQYDADAIEFKASTQRHGLRCVEKVTVWRYDRQVGIMNSKLDTQQ